MQNPFEIPEIVAILTKYIWDFDSLKCIRTMNRNWMKETLRKWRSSAIFLINNETFPILFKAFDESDLVGLPDEEREAAQSEMDPFLLKEVPFKKYRFAREQDWLYPLDQNELEKKLIWEKVISPNAIYLDVGECALKKFCGTYLIGLKWILEHSENVNELAMAPLKSSLEIPVVEGEFGSGVEAQNPHFLTLLLDAFYVDHVHSLKISSPNRHLQLNQICFGEKEENLSPLFTDDPEGEEAAKWILQGMLLNLKKLELPEEGGATAIMAGVYEALNCGTTDGYLEPAWFESITALAPRRTHALKLCKLFGYVTDRMWESHWDPPLKEVRMSIPQDSTEGHVYFCLHSVRDTLKKLELQYNYDDYFYLEPYEFQYRTAFHPEGVILGNLTHFKIVQNYEDLSDWLIKFDWSYLWMLPKLREFHFGMKNKVVKSFLKRKIHLDEFTSGFFRLDPEARDSMELPDLKSFHFHGNLETKALHRLEGIMKNLETLELVFDKENFNSVKGEGKFQRLKNLKLLTCSDIPERDITTMKSAYPALKIEDESRNYISAGI